MSPTGPPPVPPQTPASLLIIRQGGRRLYGSGRDQVDHVQTIILLSENTSTSLCLYYTILKLSEAEEVEHQIPQTPPGLRPG